MHITHIDIIPCEKSDGLVALAHITLDDVLILRMVGIYRRLDGSGYRLTYPTKGGKASQALFHPITPAMSRMWEDVIIRAYQNRNPQKSYARYCDTPNTSE